MVFTLNTTVFAEEVAVDSVEETVDASVDAVDEVAEEVTVDEATTDAGADASTTYTRNHLKYTKDGNNDPVLNSTVVYETDPNVKKNAKYNVVKMTNVDDCVSWANVYKNETRLSYDTNPKEADPNNRDVSNGPKLIYTVLKGSKDDTTNLVNNKEQAVSNNGVTTGDAAVKVGNQLRESRFATYKVIKVDDNGNYLFVGYGDTVATVTGVNGPENLCEAADIQGITDSILPVFDYDGRQIAFSKDGKHKMTGSKNERLDVAVALVKYDKTTGTLQEIPGVEVSGVKFAKKTGKDATVSGQMTQEAWSYETWTNNDKVETISKVNDVALTHNAYKKEAELGTFTINVKVSGKSIEKDVKKAIKDKLKEEKFSYAISKYVVDTAVPNRDLLFAWADTPGGAATTNYSKISDNKVAENSNTFFAQTKDEEEFKLDGNSFTISKFNEEKGKADLVFNVKTYNGKTYGDAAVKLKDGTDYKFADGTLGGGKTVKALDFTGNFEYRQGTDNSMTTNGYKYAFRQTPATDDNKKPKTFRRGIYKASGDGFVYSVDDAAEEVVAVEEAF